MSTERNLQAISELKESIEIQQATICSLRAYQDRSFVQENVERIDSQIERLIVERERYIRYHATATGKIAELYRAIARTKQDIRDLEITVPISKLGKMSAEEREKRKLRKILAEIDSFAGLKGADIKGLLSDIKSDLNLL